MKFNKTEQFILSGMNADENKTADHGFYVYGKQQVRAAKKLAAKGLILFLNTSKYYPARKRKSNGDYVGVFVADGTCYFPGR